MKHKNPQRRHAINARPMVGETIVARIFHEPKAEYRKMSHDDRAVWVLARRGGGVYVVQALRELDHHRVIAATENRDVAQLLRDTLDGLLAAARGLPSGRMKKDIEPEVFAKFARSMGLVVRSR